MNGRIKQILAAAALTAAATVTVVASGPAAGQAAVPAVQGFGLTADGLTMLAFQSQTPNVSDWVQDIVGFTGHDTYGVGLDTRPANGVIYLVANAGGIYTVDRWYITKVGQLSVALNGQSFGVDFNPAADRLRIFSNTGQNLSHDVDGNVTTAQTALTDGASGKSATGVTAGAYTNNDTSNLTATALYDVDTIANQISLQNPPAAGTLFPQGMLGVDPAQNSSMDIVSTISNGRTVANTAFAALINPVTNRSTLYSVDLTSGFATSIGNFPSVLQVGSITFARY
ncbi:DUF4394 domain-containing protein [Catenuloplanes atrovinosus]|uniref:DUF4394 domain-containing protein n=1 Tax=Catenuloplanes atrovinosus TaxID=137266 RepID=A0AAE3YNW6_9ACTN|nr:DUF4394 domain-containing protein [Catenuloplanes atrovinosus]MDR7275851.1 hypothetical protein [Catenuloplanes atrovinosus]